MITLTLPQFRAARVWLDELPPAYVEPQKVAERMLETDKPPFNQFRRGGVEFNQNVGGRNYYGLLGAEWWPSSSGQLCIRIHISESYEKPFPDSLAGVVDRVFVGLLNEYVEGIMQGVTDQSAKLGRLPEGELVFCCAAHGLVGSAHAVFKWLAAALVRILIVDPLHIQEQELSELLQERLSNR